MTDKETIEAALRYIQHVGANHVMRGEAHPQQWIVDGLERILSAPTEARRIVTVEMMQAGVHEFKDFANRLETGMSLERALVKVYEVMRALEAPVSPLAPSQEKPTVRLCGCPGVCQGYETLSKGVVCSMHVPESIVRGPQHGPKGENNVG